MLVIQNDDNAKVDRTKCWLVIQNVDNEKVSVLQMLMMLRLTEQNFGHKNINGIENVDL